MKSFLIAIVSVLVHIAICSHTVMPDTAVNKISTGSVSKGNPADLWRYDSAFRYMVHQQDKMNVAMEGIKTNLDTIKSNTEPPSLFGEFIKSKLLDEMYEWLFGGENEPGKVPLIISIIGLLSSLIRFVVLFLRYNKSESKSVQNIQTIAIASLLLLTSSLLLVLTNRNYASPQAARLEKMESKLEIMYQEILSSRKLLLADSNSVSASPTPVPDLDKLTAELSDLKNEISKSEQNTAKRIEDKSSNGLAIFFNTLLVACVLGLLVRKEYF